MELAFETQMIIYYISGVLTLFTMGLFLIRGKKSALLYSFLMFQLVVLAWILRIIFVKLFINSFVTPTSFEVITYDYYEWLHSGLRSFIHCLAGLCWLIFCQLYTGRDNGIPKRKIVRMLLSFPPLCFLPFFFSKLLINSQVHGIATFWISVVTGNVYFLLGIGLIFKYRRTHSGTVRKQSLYLLLSILFPLLLTFLQNYKRSVLMSGGIISDFDITPLGFILAILIIAVATYRYRFLHVIPVALQKLVQEMKQAIVVLDDKNRMLDCNLSFSKLFLKGVRLRKEKLMTLLESLKKEGWADFDNEGMKTAVEDGVPSQIEMRLLGSEPCDYSVQIQCVVSEDTTVIGKVVSFQNITEYKNLLAEIHLQNEELTKANAKLTHYTSVAQELAAVKERNRLSRDLHDTLGHTMTMLIALLEVSDIACEKDSELARQNIRNAAHIAREGLRELQRSIAGMTPGLLISESLALSLENLARAFSATGVDIELTLDPITDKVDPLISEALYRVCQEALTNALRHGKASQVSVILKLTGKVLKLYIIDNGCGASDIHKGYGITGMEQRIRDLGGELKVWSDGESGFHVFAEVGLVPLDCVIKEV